MATNDFKNLLESGTCIYFVRRFKARDGMTTLMSFFIGVDSEILDITEDVAGLIGKNMREIRSAKNVFRGMEIRYNGENTGKRLAGMIAEPLGIRPGKIKYKWL